MNKKHFLNMISYIHIYGIYIFIYKVQHYIKWKILEDFCQSQDTAFYCYCFSIVLEYSQCKKKRDEALDLERKMQNSHYLPVLLNFSFSLLFVCGKAQNTNGKTTSSKNLEKVGYKMNIEKSITSILKKKSTSNCWLKKMHNLRAVS